jgi:hypothetical protein
VARLAIASVFRSFALHQNSHHHRALRAAVVNTSEIWQIGVVFLGDHLSARVSLKMAKQQIQGVNRSPCSPPTTVARVRLVTREDPIVFFVTHSRL